MIRTSSIRTSGKPRFIPSATALVAMAVLVMLAIAPAAFAGQVQSSAPAAAPEHSAAGIRSAAFPLPQGLQDEPGAQDFRAGREAALQQRWQEALRHFDAVIVENPGMALVDDATYWAARCLH